jgi:NADH-quinone oxidoreductase subunit A
MSPTFIVAYLAMFAGVGFLFVLASLVLGSFLRPRLPTSHKLATYECGEPAIGSGSVQFDLRFYVVAMLFLIFEVEVAFFFPTAAIFGESTRQLARQERPKAEVKLAEQGSADAKRKAETLVVPASRARTAALAALIDLAVFFGVLLAAFAFVWRRGDLNWVRAVRHPATPLESNVLAARLLEGSGRS